MKTRYWHAFLTTGIILGACPAHGSKQDRPNAAVVVEHLSPRTLREGDDNSSWRWIPSFLRGADIHSVGTGHNGVSNFKVSRSGTLYMAAHYGYEGNSSGGWTKERVTFEELVDQGWTYVVNMKHGNGCVFRIFRREVEAGEHYRIRVNKYSLPCLITLNSQAGTLLSAETPWPVFGPVALSDFTPQPLHPSSGNTPGAFKQVPSSLRGMTIFSEERRPHAGVLEFHVIDETRVYLAGFWGYEGNHRGDWDDERMTLQQMIDLGWKHVEDMVLANGRVYNVLTKVLPAGQTHRIRCNKYSPPLLMLKQSSYERDYSGRQLEDLAPDNSDSTPRFDVVPSSYQPLTVKPVLSIDRTGEEVTVKWFPAIPGSYLEKCDELGNQNWRSVPSGTANPSCLPTAASTRFFRVVIPQ